MFYRFERWKEVYPPNAAMMRYILVSEGYQVFQWGDSPEMMFPIKKDPEDQTHWVVFGEIEITVERFGSVILKPGDRDFVPAHTYHSMRITSPESAVYLIGKKIKK